MSLRNVLKENADLYLSRKEKRRQALRDILDKRDLSLYDKMMEQIVTSLYEEVKTLCISKSLLGKNSIELTRLYYYHLLNEFECFDEKYRDQFISLLNKEELSVNLDDSPRRISISWD